MDDSLLSFEIKNDDFNVGELSFFSDADNLLTMMETFDYTEDKTACNSDLYETFSYSCPELALKIEDTEETTSFSDYFDVHNKVSPFYDPNNHTSWYIHKAVTLEAAMIDFPEGKIASPGFHFAYTMQRLDLPYILSPSPKLGIVANSDFSQASYAYAALSWNIFITDNLYVNADFGVRAQSESDEKDYGSLFQFHESLGIYYRFFEGRKGFHEVGGSISHGSHAGLFGDENPGLDTITLGYRFSFK